MAVDTKDVAISFDNKEFEMNKIIANNEYLNMNIYYAHIDGNTLNIYSNPNPNPNPLEITLYDLVTDNIIEYKFVDGQAPAGNYAVFYLVNKNAEFDQLADFKVSDFNYVFPCLSKTEFDKAQAKIKENKDKEKRKQDEAIAAAEEEKRKQDEAIAAAAAEEEKRKQDEAIAAAAAAAAAEEEKRKQDEAAAAAEEEKRKQDEAIAAAAAEEEKRKQDEAIAAAAAEEEKRKQDEAIAAAAAEEEKRKQDEAIAAAAAAEEEKRKQDEAIAAAAAEEEKRKQDEAIAAAAAEEEKRKQDEAAAGLVPVKLYETNADGTPKIIFFTGGSDLNISEKLKKLYDTLKWEGNTKDNNNEFFYIEKTDKTQIIAVVRINNTKFELDFDLVHKDFQKQKLYDFLLKARLKYILENKKNMYVLYTEHDYLKKSHVKNGMTLISNDKVMADDNKQYFKFEYNRDPRTLVTQTKFQNGGVCSGIAIGNNNLEEFIYTATHCLKSPGQNDTLPNYVSHLKILNAEIKTTFVKENSMIKYKIPVTKTEEEDNNKFYIEYADDIAVFNTIPLLDTTNIFLIDNCKDIPKESKLDCWGAISDWKQSTLVDDNDIITNFVNIGAFPSDNFEKVYPDWKIDLGDGNIIYKHEKYFRLIDTPPKSGDSGGPHGFFFNRNTGVIGPTELCFAVCFTTSSKVNIGDDSSNKDYGVVISASRWIDWLKGLGININIAHYNIDSKTINILPSNITPGGSGKTEKPGGSRKTFRVSRRKKVRPL
jgi:hypothetical protein